MNTCVHNNFVTFLFVQRQENECGFSQLLSLDANGAPVERDAYCKLDHFDLDSAIESNVGRIVKLRYGCLVNSKSEFL